MDNRLQKRYVVAEDWIALEAALAGEIGDLKRDDPLRPLTVVARTGLLAGALEERAARVLGGIANVGFRSFGGFAGELFPGGEAGHPLAGRLVAEEVITRPAAGARAFPRSFAESLVRTFDDLAEGGCGAGEAERLASSGELGGKARDALAFFAAWRRRLAAIGEDGHARLEAAAAAVAADPPGGPVLFYGFYDMNELQWRLCRAVASSAGAVLFLPSGEGDAFRFAGEFRRRLDEAGFDGEHAPGTGAGTVSLETMTAPDAEEEARAVVRRILRLAGEESVPFHRIAVFPFAADEYAPLLLDAFREAGVPVTCRGPLAGSPRSSAAGALLLVAALRGGLQRSALIDLLSSPGARGATGISPADVDEWIRLGADAGLRGEDGWVAETAELGARLEGNEAAAVARVATILRPIEDGARRLAAASSWREAAASLAGLAAGLLVADEDQPAVLESIRRLGTLDGTGAAVTAGRFLDVAREIIEALPDRRSRAEKGVFVSSPGAARGLTFDAVFLPGLVEGVAPRRAGQDPFMPDRDRERLAGLTGGGVVLSRRARRTDEEMLIFHLAAGAARELIVCSRPRYETGTGRETIPASLMEDLSAAWRRLGRPVRSVDHARSWHAPAETEPLGEGERALLAALQTGKLADGDRFAGRGARMVEARWEKGRFTPWDGVFAGTAAVAALQRRLEKRDWRFSPTALEEYASCPFAFFVSRLLGLSPLEEPGEIVTITPLQRGSVVHRILAAGYERLSADGLLPMRPETAQAACEVIREVAGAELERLAGEEPTGVPAFWRWERARIVSSLEEHVAAEASAAEAAVPVMFERSFGFDVGSGPAIEAAGRRIGFRGRIDRLDVDGERGFRVVDYKTGTLTRFRDESIQRGTALQLPVYLLAGAAELGRDVADGEARYVRIGEGGGSVRFSGKTWQERGEEIVGAIRVIVEGIAAGRFPALPDAQGCARTFCGARSICLAGRAAMRRLKDGDPAVDELLRLRGERDDEGGGARR